MAQKKTSNLYEQSHSSDRTYGVWSLSYCEVVSQRPRECEREDRDIDTHRTSLFGILSDRAFRLYTQHEFDLLESVEAKAKFEQRTDRVRDRNVHRALEGERRSNLSVVCQDMTCRTCGSVFDLLCLRILCAMKMMMVMMMMMMMARVMMMR